MINVFKELSQMAGLVGKLPKIKEEITRIQQKAGEIIAEGKAGGDMVTVRANAKFTILSCKLSEEAMGMQDQEMLEDLIRAATNKALDRARDMLMEEMQKAAGDIGLPDGMGIPGMLP
jgi:DNA-binding YbaB/EbfC family protein